MTKPQKFTIILLTIPDGRIVLQRRTKDAPYGANKLGLFGGWVEDHEEPDDCIKREIGEETSLQANDLIISPSTDFTIPGGVDFPFDRHFFLYGAEIEDTNFTVYEGQGAEAINPDAVLDRDDLLPTARYVFENVVKLQSNHNSNPA